MRSKCESNRLRVRTVISLAITAVAAIVVAAAAIPAAAAPKHGGNSADLSLSGQVFGEPAGVGQPLTFHFSVDNNGSATAPNVKLTDSFDPAQLDFIGAEGPYNSVLCTASSGTVVCDFGTLDAWTGYGVDLTFRPKVEGTTLKNTATVTSGARDPNLQNNSVEFSIPVVFIIHCSGRVASSSYVRPGYGYPSPQPSWYSCSRTFEVTSARTAELEIRPNPVFSGELFASLRPSSGASESVRAVFGQGQTVGITSKTVQLTPGTWKLTVGTTATGQSHNLISGWPICTPDRSWPYLCLPVTPPWLGVSWFVSAGSGGYYGHVVDRTAGGD